MSEKIKPYKNYGSIVTKQWILDKFGTKVEFNQVHILTYIIIDLVERIEKLEAKK